MNEPMISALHLEGVRPLAAPGKAQGAPGLREPGEDSRSPRPKPMTDEYVPQEPPEPSGRYWMGRDGDGQPKIQFDGPERPEEKWEGNTDQVDREIEKLKKKKEELEQRLGTETDEAKIRELERRLAQVERELRQKDNDTYRRQHAAFTRVS